MFDICGNNSIICNIRERFIVNSLRGDILKSTQCMNSPPKSCEKVINLSCGKVINLSRNLAL